MIIEHIGSLIDEFITFYSSSIRFLSIEQFVTTTTNHHIIIYLEFLHTKHLFIHMYSLHFELVFGMGEYIIYKESINPILNFTDRYYFAIIRSLDFINNEKIPF